MSRHRRPRSLRSALSAIRAIALLASAFAACRAPEPRPAPNVLLVSLDTLRADVATEMPYLSSRAATGLAFPRVYSASNWTLPSHASLFLSQPVSEHHVPPVRDLPPYAGARLPEASTLVSEAFRDAGYDTFGTVEGGYVSPEFGFGRGFADFLPVAALSHDPASDLDRHVAALGAAVIRANGRPLFAFVHTYLVHDYFLNLPRFHARLAPEDAGWVGRGSLLDQLRVADGTEPSPEFLRRLYLGAALEADAFLRRLVETVVAADPSRPWLVAVTSDHGEGFDRDPRLRSHGSALVEPQVRVPWVVWQAGAPSRRRLASAAAPLAGGIDVAPSLLGWAGLPVPASFRGRPDLLTRATTSPGGPREIAWVLKGGGLEPRPELALVGPRRAFLRRVQPAPAPPPRCLELVREHVGLVEWLPGELTCEDLERDAVSRLRGWLRAAAETPTSDGRSPSPELVEELRSLGYL